MDVIQLKTLIYPQKLQWLLQQYQLTLVITDDNDIIPGSYWGDSEAGLIGQILYARLDTPIHSILHESCHYICMDQKRRKALHTNAGGSYDEENAVCYLQILLSDQLTEVTATRMMQDMDTWGYTFRLGSAKQWYTKDAKDAYTWLVEYHIITDNKKITFNIRH